MVSIFQVPEISLLHALLKNQKIEQRTIPLASYIENLALIDEATFEHATFYIVNLSTLWIHRSVLTLTTSVQWNPRLGTVSERDSDGWSDSRLPQYSPLFWLTRNQQKRRNENMSSRFTPLLGHFRSHFIAPIRAFVLSSSPRVSLIHLSFSVSGASFPAY